MYIEVLVSCMNQSDFSIAKKINIKSNALIVNQSNRNSYSETQLGESYFKMISSKQRGLTKSRNLALANASSEICVICDDDVEYEENYIEIIQEAFEKLPNASVIIFNINRINHNRSISPFKKVKKSPRYKSYGSVRIAFKLKDIKQNNIWFDENFGSGGIYSSGEETLFLQRIRKNKLKIFEYPANIATVDFMESTWREGFNEKYFYDKGALLSAAYPILKYIFAFYYVKISRRSANLSILSILMWIFKGMRGYKKLLSYEQYKKIN